MTALYELAREYRTQAEALSDLDLPAEVIADTMEGMAGDLEVKSNAVAFVVRNLESTADAIKEAEGKMAARRKAIENRAAHLKRYLLDSMQYAGVQKLSGPYFTIAVRENPAAVVVDAADLIPAEFMRWPDPVPPPPTVDKAAIKAAIQAGQDVPGVHLERGVRLEIR